MTLAVTYALLQDGTSYPQQTVLDVKAKEITVKVTNSGKEDRVVAPYSARNAVVGSTRVARRAGIQLAAIAAAASTTVATPTVVRSAPRRRTPSRASPRP